MHRIHRVVGPSRGQTPGMTSTPSSPTISPLPVPLFTRADAVSAGISDKQLRTGPYRRVLHGIYTESATRPTHALKCRAAAMTLPADAIITGRSAATLRGTPLAGAQDDVDVLVNRDKYMNRRAGVRCWSRTSAPDEHNVENGLRVATPTRAAFDILSRYSIKFGVAYLDALLHDRMVDSADLGGFLANRTYYGGRRAKRAFALLDPRAESIPESVLRVTLNLHGLRPTPQLRVYDGSEFVARVDLGFPHQRLAVEYEGAWHADPEQHRRDRNRLYKLRHCGWTVIVVTAQRLHGDAEGIVAEIRHALRAR